MLLSQDTTLRCMSTDEAKAKRAARRASRRSQAPDPLAERARKIAFWKKCAKTNRAYEPHNGAWWWVFTWQPWGLPLLMPKLRALLAARQAARDRAYRAELSASAKAWAAKKAARAAERRRANAPQQDMFTGAGAERRVA